MHLHSSIFGFLFFKSKLYRNLFLALLNKMYMQGK